MKYRILTILFLVSLFSFGFHATESQAVDLATSVTMPAGTVGFHISKIIANCPFDGTTDTWPTFPSPSLTSLSFATLSELTALTYPPCPAVDTGVKLGVFGPSDRGYYAVDIAVSGGGFPPSVSVTTSMPSDPAIGTTTLGHKILATYTHVTFVGPAATNTVDDATPFGIGNLATGRTLGTSDFTGHWVRIYIGVAIPHATALSGDDPVTKLPPNTFPWTASDPASSFSGMFRIDGAGSPI